MRDIAKTTAYTIFIAGVSAWLMLGAAGAVVGSQRAVLFGGTAQAVAPPLIGALMLEDGTSFLLLEDASSHLCFEGGAC